MKPFDTIRSRSSRLGLGLALLLLSIPATPVHAQSADAADEDVFLAAVSEARGVAHARIDEVQGSIEAACLSLAEEACNRIVSEQLPQVAAELEAYAGLVEELEAPAEYARAVSSLVSALRDDAQLVGETVAAADGDDAAAMIESQDRRFEVMAQLYREVDPAWADHAFVSSLGGDIRPSPEIRELTTEEQAYFDGVRAADRAAAENFSCFNRAVTATYVDTDGLLQALSDCGAGEALPAIEAAASRLEPPERFADEHAWWLSALAERSRLDRLIGAAAAEGDLTGFLANNARLGLVFRPPAGLDPAFLQAYPGPGATLDPNEPLAATAYGLALFQALAAYDYLNPFLTAANAIDFPQVPRADALPTIVELGPELRALNDELRGAIAALQPPAELAADHDTISEFLDTYTRGLEDLIEAAEAGDVDTTFALQNAATAVYCDAAGKLSDAILPVASAFLSPGSPACR